MNEDLPDRVTQLEKETAVLTVEVKTVIKATEEIAGMRTQLTELTSTMKSLTKLAEDYVTNSRFQPVQLLVYGLVGLILTSVFAAVLARVILPVAEKVLK
jgi:hypothetical protein